MSPTVAAMLSMPPVDEAAVVKLLSTLSPEAAATPAEDGMTLLMLAAAAGASAVCSALLRMEVDMDATDAFGLDALFHAVCHLRHSVVDLLLVAKASTEAQGKAGGTPLIEAASRADEHLVQLLCAARAGVDARDIVGDCAVKAGLRRSAWDVLMVLASFGATWGPDEMAASEGGWHSAQGAGALEAGRTAFVLGIEGCSARSLPMLVDADGTTPLHVCAMRNWQNGARVLLHAKANPRARDAEGRDACLLAARQCNHRVVRELLVNGASAKATSRHGGETALMAAAASSSVKAIAMLYEANAELEARDSKGRTALLVAVQRGASIGTVCLLVGLRANVEVKANEDRRSYHAIMTEAYSKEDVQQVVGCVMLDNMANSGLGGVVDTNVVPTAPLDRSATGAECFKHGISLRHRCAEREARKQTLRKAAERRRRMRSPSPPDAPEGAAEEDGREPAPPARGASPRLSLASAMTSPAAFLKRISVGGGGATTGERAGLLDGPDTPFDDLDENESESPSEAAARVAVGPTCRYDWNRDRDFVRKQRIERWARSISDEAADNQHEAHDGAVAPAQAVPDAAAGAADGGGDGSALASASGSHDATLIASHDAMLVASLDASLEVLRDTSLDEVVPGAGTPAQAASGTHGASTDPPRRSGGEGEAGSGALSPLMLSARLPSASELEALHYETSERVHGSASQKFDEAERMRYAVALPSSSPHDAARRDASARGGRIGPGEVSLEDGLMAGEALLTVDDDDDRTGSLAAGALSRAAPARGAREGHESTCVALTEASLRRLDKLNSKRSARSLLPASKLRVRSVSAVL